MVRQQPSLLRHIDVVGVEAAMGAAAGEAEEDNNDDDTAPLTQRLTPCHNRTTRTSAPPTSHRMSNTNTAGSASATRRCSIEESVAALRTSPAAFTQPSFSS